MPWPLKMAHKGGYTGLTQAARNLLILRDVLLQADNPLLGTKLFAIIEIVQSSCYRRFSVRAIRR